MSTSLGTHLRLAPHAAQGAQSGSRRITFEWAAFAVLAVLLAGLFMVSGAAITCPTVPANAVSIAAVFGASKRDASNAAAILNAALSSTNASAPSLFWAPSMRLNENQSAPIGAAGIATDSEVAAFLAATVECKVSFIVSTSCASGAIQLFVAQNATAAGAANGTWPAVVHAAVCSAYQTPSQLAFAAAMSKLPPLLRVSHSLGAHAELTARTLRSFNWTRCGVLLDLDQYDPALVPAVDRMLPIMWIAVPVVDASALANASSFPLSSSSSTASAALNATAELGTLTRQFFRSTATIDVLRLYARSLREQNAKVVIVFCGGDLLPRLWAALHAEGMTGSGFAVLLAESLVSSDVFSPATPASFAAAVPAAPSGGTASAFDASAPRAFDPDAPASIASVARDKSYVLAQGTLGMRPVGSVTAPLSSSSSEATQHDRFVAAIAPRAAADVGASAPFLWDAVAVVQQMLTAAASLSLAFPLSSAANASEILSLLVAVAARPSFEGASGNLDFISADAPTVSPLAKIMHEDETYVSQFAPLDWSKAPFAPSVYLSTLQRLVTGAATLWNAKGAAFVPVAAFTPNAVNAVQTHAIMWPGALREPPAGVILPIAIWTQLSVSDGFSGLLASLLAIDLINSVAYSASAPAVLGASSAFVISHTGVSQPTVRTPIPASLLPLLPPLPPGVLLESSRDGLRPDDACSPNAAASLATMTAMLSRNIYNFTTGAPRAIVGPYCSETVQTVNHLAVASQTAMISFGASSSGISSAATYPTFLRLLTSTSIQSRVILSFLAARGLASFALIITADTYGFSGSSDLNDWGPTFRVRKQHTVSVSVTASVATIQAAMQSLAGAGAPTTFVAFVNGGNVFANVLEAAANLGISTSAGRVWLAANSAYDSTILALAQSNANVRAALIDVFFVRRSADATQAMIDFRTLYTKVFPMFPPPSSHGTFAFDAMLIAARGAAQEYQANAFAALTSSAMNVSMNARIRSQAHTGITGPIRFVSAFTDRFGQSRAWYVGQMQSTSVGGNDLSLIEVATFDANLVASVDLNRLKSAGANSNPQCAGGNQWMSAASFATFSASPIAQSSPSVAFGHGTPFAVSVSRNSGVCIPCAFGFYSVASVCVACPPGTLCPLATATPVPVDTAFVLGSLAPSADSGNASASFTGSMFAVELGARDTNTLAFEHGPIVSPQTLREIQLSYLYSVAGVAFVICLVFVAFVCMSRVDECKRLRALLRKADIVFTTDHPTRVGRPVMKRKTSIGGFCAIVFVLTVSLVTAVLVHSWSASYYSIVADFQSYLIVPGAGAVETSDFIIEAHFLGVDLSLACAHACESVIGAASSDELPTFETMSAASSFTSPFTSSLPRTFSTRADRTACIAVTDAAAAAAIGCGAFSASSRAIGSRSFLWSEGLPGTFQCAQTTAASTATAPPPRAASFVPFSPPPALTPPSSCVIRFTPSSFVRQQQRLPATFAVHMSLPSARAAAISWRVRSARINGTDAGARGTFLPPSSTSTSAMPSSLLGGLAPSRVRLSLQPFVFTGDAVNAQHLPAFATGYEAYLAAKVVGSTVSAADLVNETATSAAGVSAATLASPILDVPVEAAAVAFEFATSVAGQQFSLAPTQTVISLLTSLSALASGVVFTVLRLLMRWSELFAAACCARRVNGTGVIPPEIEVADDDADGAGSDESSAKRASMLPENSAARLVSVIESSHGGSDSGSVHVDMLHSANSFELRRLNMYSPNISNHMAHGNPHEGNVATAASASAPSSGSNIELAVPNPLFQLGSTANLTHPESSRPDPPLPAAHMPPSIPPSAPPALASDSDEFAECASVATSTAPAHLAAIVSSAQSKAPSPRDLFASRKTRLQMQPRPSRQFSV